MCLDNRYAFFNSYLWNILTKRLQHWTTYVHHGVARVIDDATDRRVEAGVHGVVAVGRVAVPG